jgi:hypothetical protein
MARSWGRSTVGIEEGGVNRLQLYVLQYANDMRHDSDDDGCGIEAVVRASSRGEAARILRSVDVGGFSARDLQRSTGAHLPAPDIGDVWTRRLYEDDGWRRRGRN